MWAWDEDSGFDDAWGDDAESRAEFADDGWGADGMLGEAVAFGEGVQLGGGDGFADGPSDDYRRDEFDDIPDSGAMASFEAEWGAVGTDHEPVFTYGLDDPESPGDQMALEASASGDWSEFQDAALPGDGEDRQADDDDDIQEGRDEYRPPWL